MRVVFLKRVRYPVSDIATKQGDAKMTKRWTVEDVLNVAHSFQPACVLAAGATLDVFSSLHGEPATARKLASRLGADRRATTILLDALAALEFLTKQGDVYSVPADVAELLSEQSPDSILPMARHLGNCLRRWAMLAEVARTGRRAEAGPSIRGEAADQADFIGAMHAISKPIAAQIIGHLQPLKFHHLLDIGGGPGTWTMAFLRAVPEARATLFDLPPVIEMARARFVEAGLADRVTLVGGDFYADELPAGADLAWLGAICHQNSRERNRALFAKIHRALADGGAVVIRDMVMDSSHTSPLSGALFAVNMLAGTDGGGTYSFDEYSQDLHEAGFGEAVLVHRDEAMSSLIRAQKA
jgi:precorrin-6B methylase 2